MALTPRGERERERERKELEGATPSESESESEGGNERARERRGMDLEKRAGAAGDLWRYDPRARVWTDLTHQVRRLLLFREFSRVPSRLSRVTTCGSKRP